MAGLNLSHSFRDVTLSVGSWKTVASWRAPGGGGTNDQMVRLSSLKLASNGQSGDSEALGIRLARVQAGAGDAATPEPLSLRGQVPPARRERPELGIRRIHRQGGNRGCGAAHGPHRWDGGESIGT